MTGPMNSKKWLAASVLLGLLLIAAFLLRHRSAGAQDAPPPAAISRYLPLHDAGPVNAQQIADAAEGLFDDDAAGTTQAFILMRDGKIIAERYGDGIRPETKLLSRSIGKTVTAALIGLMVSLGASSIVGQGASGLILMYSRTLRTGEYVRIGEHEGTIVDISLFTTRLRTGEIGAECGFTDLSYFTKTFREIKHCTPREYRQRFAVQG